MSQLCKRHALEYRLGSGPPTDAELAAISARVLDMAEELTGIATRLKGQRALKRDLGRIITALGLTGNRIDGRLGLIATS